MSCPCFRSTAPTKLHLDPDTHPSGFATSLIVQFEMYQLHSFHPHCVSGFLKLFSPGCNTNWVGIFWCNQLNIFLCWMVAQLFQVYLMLTLHIWPYFALNLTPTTAASHHRHNIPWFSHHLMHFPLDTLSWPRGPQFSYFKHFIPEYLWHNCKISTCPSHQAWPILWPQH